MQILQLGSSGSTVQILKHYLNLLMTPSPNLNEANRVFDKATASAVSSFKLAAGLMPANAVVNAQTWGEIGGQFARKLPPNRPEKTVGRCFINNETVSIPDWLQNLSLIVVDGPLNFDQAIFLKAYMAQYGALDESKTRSLNQLLKFIDLDPAVLNVEWAAYMMATVKHECADTWQPIEESGKGEGYEYGKPVTFKGSDGETYKQTFYGRGYVQLTWLHNYKRLGKAMGVGDQLAIHPEKLLEPETAYTVLSLWMNGGYSANGKRIMDYTLGPKPNYTGARHLVNGSDQASLIAGYAVQLEAMLRASLV